MTFPADLDKRFRDAAAGSGLLDVAYDLVNSPVGDLLVAVTANGICTIAFEARAEQEIETLAARRGRRVLRVTRSVDPARRELDEYFAGSRHVFDLALDLEGVAEFNRLVLAELARVPYGETTTYGSLARRVGHPTAARAVGTVMNRNPIPIILPCHRVVGANGSLTGYAGGLWMKERLLAREGARLAV